jgi:hypothetical protein
MSHEPADATKPRRKPGPRPDRLAADRPKRTKRVSARCESCEFATCPTPVAETITDAIFDLLAVTP